MRRILPAIAILLGLSCFTPNQANAQTNGFNRNQGVVPGQSIADEIPLAGQPARSGLLARPNENEVVQQASSVLKEIMDIPAQRIPISLLKNAEGVAIIPNMIKGGFVIGGKRGHGVVLVRDDKGSWHAPSFITLTGGSVGLQAGIQSTDVVLVFKTRKSVDGLLQGKFTLGADAAVAAGPVGREAAAATDGRLRAEIYSYSRSRGLFAGVALDGSVIQIDAAADASYYGVSSTGQVQQVPAPAIKLIEQVIAYTSETEENPGGLQGQNPAPLTGTTGYPNQNVNTQQPNPQYGTGQQQGNQYNQNVSTSTLLRQDLAAVWPKLSPLLDARWQAYLAMPREIFAAQTDPSMDSLATVIAHYDKVAADPRYRLLTEQQSFQSAHQLLHDYYKALQNTGNTNLRLGNPPGR